ncbi:MAG: ABC transporter permease [Endozoicomonadaceae bacterium]|nr:ABC transporter permease [Endozoicomonadaceae bacterium]
MKPVLLWSDTLVYLMVTALISFVFAVRHNPKSSAHWREIFASRLGMVTFIIILTYVSVALLDSLHFRKALLPTKEHSHQQVFYSNQVYSVLDLLLGEMGDNDERTYSAPFALKSFVKQNRSTHNGGTIRDYPVLKHAGNHLASPDDQVGDISLQSLVAIGKGLLISALFIVLHIVWRRTKNAEKSSELPWKVAYITLTITLCLLIWLIELGNLYHVLGTDQAGNDTLHKTLKSIRTGILIGTLATVIMIPIAIVFGISAGYFKGWTDDIIQYIYVTLSSIPGILLIAASVLLFQIFMNNNPSFFEVGLEKADAKFLGLCFILGVTNWAGLCRILRAETLKISQLEYVQAAHVFGVSHWRILMRHILPNVMPIILITFVLDFSGLVLAEAVLSYIGVGIDPAMASWGNMINMSRAELSRDPVIWWNLIAAMLFMFTLVLATNLFSDLVNDAFNPKTQMEAKA